MERDFEGCDERDRVRKIVMERPDDLVVIKDRVSGFRQRLKDMKREFETDLAPQIHGIFTERRDLKTQVNHQVSKAKALMGIVHDEFLDIHVDLLRLMQEEIDSDASAEGVFDDDGEPDRG